MLCRIAFISLFVMSGATFASPTTPLVTGNGFGYAVVSSRGEVVRLYAHPYSTARAGAAPQGDGIAVAQFFKSLTWQAGRGVSQVSALEESHVVRVRNESATATFFMPFSLERAALIAVGEGRGCWNLELSSKILRDDLVTIDGSSIRVLNLKGADERLAIVPLFEGAPSREKCLRGEAWAFVAVGGDTKLEDVVRDVRRWQDGEKAAALGAREVRAHEAWRSPAPSCAANAEARRVWRQNETILRLSQIREAGPARGLLNASLPEGEFFVPFVRDMSYALAALVARGHRDEARLAATSFYEARPIGVNIVAVGQPYQISTVRYFGNGAEEADYSGHSEPNLELDNWGIALWASGTYFARWQDVEWLGTKTYRGTIFENMRDFVVKPLLSNLVEKNGGLVVAPDSSIWEQNDEKRKHYAFSTIAAIAGLRSFLAMASAVGDVKTIGEVQSKLSRLESGFRAVFVRDGHLRGTADGASRNDMDGALLEAINLGVLPVESGIARSIFDRMERLRVPSGGYRRTLGSTDYEKQEFLFIDFALARALLRSGDSSKAASVVARIVKKAAIDNGAIPEMYHSVKTEEFDGALGAPAGAIPMVGYGAGAYGLYLHDFETFVGCDAASESRNPASAKRPGKGATGRRR